MTGDPASFDEDLVESTRLAAQTALAREWDAPVEIAVLNAGEAVRYRSTVLRCLASPAPAPGLTRVIVKSARGRGARHYDPTDLTATSAAGRLLNEWAGFQFVGQLPVEPALCPQFLAGDRAAGIIVLEDLGDGPCLADLLQGTDAGRAREGLLAYARDLGRLHAATHGCADQLAAISDQTGLPPSSRKSTIPVQFWEGLARLREVCSRLGAGWSPTVEGEIASLVAAVTRPGPFAAFTAGDTCPDNHRFVSGHARFFDFEWCGFKHALLDAAYLHVPFPTCLCVNRLPANLVHEANSVYRVALAAGCPAATDDSAYASELRRARAFWLIMTVGDRLDTLLETDDRVGTATMRQRHLLRLDEFVADADELDGLPALTNLARELAQSLRSRWGPEAEMPLYPAFRD